MRQHFVITSDELCIHIHVDFCHNQSNGDGKCVPGSQGYSFDTLKKPNLRLFSIASQRVQQISQFHTHPLQIVHTNFNIYSIFHLIYIVSVAPRRNWHPAHFSQVHFIMFVAWKLTTYPASPPATIPSWPYSLYGGSYSLY